MRSVARELCTRRRSSPAHPCLGAMGPVVTGCRCGCKVPCIWPLHFSGDRKRAEVAECCFEGSKLMPPASPHPPRVSLR